MGGILGLILTGAPIKIGGNVSYQTRVKNLFGANLIGYWPLDEASGTVAYDRSGNGLNGTYANVSLANTVNLIGKPCPLFNGTTSTLDIYSAALNTAFNNQEGFLSVNVKATDANTWAAAGGETPVSLYSGAANMVLIQTINNSMVIRYLAGNTYKDHYFYTVAASALDWINFTFSWSKSGDAVRAWVNGVNFRPTQTGLGVWSGNLNSGYSRIGSQGAALAFWGGNIHDVVLGNRYIIDAEALALCPKPGRRLLFLGDSITAAVTSLSYTDRVVFSSGDFVRQINRSVGGTSIASGLSTQVTAAANDNADIIIIAMGTNDNDGGNMTTLQATAEAQIAALKLSNPNATIYWLNALPRWTDNTGATPVAKDNIRAAIAAACTAQSITCWDTVTDPWITAAQTSDGLHPIAAGAAAIATRVLALI